MEINQIYLRKQELGQLEMSTSYFYVNESLAFVSETNVDFPIRAILRYSHYLAILHLCVSSMHPIRLESTQDIS
jgi:hypothetical protein